jgi:hypothetical protein
MKNKESTNANKKNNQQFKQHISPKNSSPFALIRYLVISFSMQLLVVHDHQSSGQLFFSKIFKIAILHNQFSRFILKISLDVRFNFLKF